MSDGLAGDFWQFDAPERRKPGTNGAREVGRPDGLLVEHVAQDIARLLLHRPATRPARMRRRDLSGSSRFRIVMLAIGFVLIAVMRI